MTGLRLDRLLGRKVLTANHRVLGRVEEFRAARQGPDWIVTGCVIGPGGLLERLGVGLRLILGKRGARGFVARWEQLDLANPERPRLTCPVDELRPL